MIERERRGDYLGKTVQVVPHITDAIQARDGREKRGRAGRWSDGQMALRPAAREEHLLHGPAARPPAQPAGSVGSAPAAGAPAAPRLALLPVRAQDWIQRVAHVPVDGRDGVPDVCVIELGGTVGDIESMPFIEALRQFQFRVGPGACAPREPRAELGAGAGRAAGACRWGAGCGRRLGSPA